MKSAPGVVWVGVVLMASVASGAPLQSPSAAAPSKAPTSRSVPTNAMKAFIESLPADPKNPPFDETQALALVALPLSCIDHPQTRSEESSTGYLFDLNTRLIEGYDRRRMFYGCADWHSAVNSTWTLIRTLKTFPKIAVAQLIREKLASHLDAPNAAGEMEFFKDAKSFERPYGYAWLLKVYGELSSWDDADARGWSLNLAALSNAFVARIATYLKDLQFPMRAGVHSNTANSLSLMFDYADQTNDAGFRAVLADTAKRLFMKDEDCPTAYEPSGSDFLSPCLVEAVAMARALDRADFVKWYDRFMPAPDSDKFKPLITAVEITTKQTEALRKNDFINDKVHLIGLSFHRAEALSRIADALPGGDPRAAVYRRLAAIHAQRALSTVTDGGYAGSHWVGTYWLLYGVSQHN
jgi:hypothetical protein